MCYRSSTSYAPRKTGCERGTRPPPPTAHAPPHYSFHSGNSQDLPNYTVARSQLHAHTQYLHAHRAPRYQDYRYASSTHPGVWSNKEMILPALGIFTICLLILMFPSATGLVCQKMYSEVHNLAFQGPSWDIDKKFGTEPIAQERCFTKSSRWLTVLSGCPRTPRGTPFVT